QEHHSMNRLAALLIMEQTPHRACRRIRLDLFAVKCTLGERSIQRVQDEVELRNRLVERPEAKLAALDDAGLFRVQKLAFQLLAADRRAFVLGQRLEEC